MGEEERKAKEEQSKKGNEFYTGASSGMAVEDPTERAAQSDAGPSQSSSPAAAAAPVEPAGPKVSEGSGSVEVDASKPKTKIQIRFQDGSRKAQEFNEESTVGDLRSYCSQVVGGGPMTVKGGYPPKDITDDSLTLKAAGLCGAA